MSDETIQNISICIAVAVVICFCFGSLTKCTMNTNIKKAEITKAYLDKGYIEKYDMTKRVWEWKKDEDTTIIRD